MLRSLTTSMGIVSVAPTQTVVYLVPRYPPSISTYLYASSLTKAKTIHQPTQSYVHSKSVETAIESTSQLVPFPLLTNGNYTACTIPWRFPSDDPSIPTPTELSWINLLLNTIPTFKKHAENDTSVPDAANKAENFAQRYARILEDFKKDPASQGRPLDILILCRLREQVLREQGFRDIFKKIKDVENANAISLFQNVVHLNDAIEDEGKRLENLVRGIFAGNIFDLGATQVIIFVDNSGADVILGILPFARELLRRGSQVILAANDLPSINDVTYSDLIEIIPKLKDEEGRLTGVSTSNLLIANSGNDLPVIDLTRVSQELAYLANDVDLVILEGMGRGIETNLYAQFKCDSLKIGMVKHPEVAEFLGSLLALIWYRKHAESDTSVPDAANKAEEFAQRFARIIEDFKKDPASQGVPLDVLLPCRLREQVLKELGFRDIFKKIKDVENANAISLFENVVHLNDAIEDEGKRLENLVRGIFAGNIFDLGASQVIIFVDNSGADIILGILPFARELLRHGSQVILAANDLPSLNDVTYAELLEIISKLKDEEGCLMGVSTSNLIIANSGNDLPVIDLTRVSQELAYLANDADLVILEGMGRGIETNLYAQFKCDSLKIAMVKHPEVAEFLGSRLYDCVIKYDETKVI
ncbi:Uncharacterized protein GmHk_20G058995 [Glycine max]|nr:Uncharacterized protein GmHk_20G058995 [Glycine max]